jgi:hypothetical protein
MTIQSINNSFTHSESQAYAMLINFIFESEIRE